MLDILNIPIIFNFIRFLIAGEQANTKKFVCDAITKYKCKKILDICCGTGDFAECANKATYMGVDIQKSYIAYARSKYANDNKKTFIEKDIISHPLSLPEKFDCVFLISTLHHFSDRHLDILFQQIKKNINGVIIIADLDKEPRGILRKIMVFLDRGKYIRTNSAKIKLLKKYFKLIENKIIYSKLAIQFGIICHT